jgi:hypothetical protein
MTASQQASPAASVRVPAPAEMVLAAEPARQLVRPAAGLHIAEALTAPLLFNIRLTISIAEVCKLAHLGYRQMIINSMIIMRTW